MRGRSAPSADEAWGARARTLTFVAASRRGAGVDGYRFRVFLWFKVFQWWDSRGIAATPQMFDVRSRAYDLGHAVYVVQLLGPSVFCAQPASMQHKGRLACPQCLLPCSPNEVLFRFRNLN